MILLMPRVAGMYSVNFFLAIDNIILFSGCLIVVDGGHRHLVGFAFKQVYTVLQSVCLLNMYCFIKGLAKHLG